MFVVIFSFSLSLCRVLYIIYARESFVEFHAHMFMFTYGSMGFKMMYFHDEYNMAQNFLNYNGFQIYAKTVEASSLRNVWQTSALF